MNKTNSELRKMARNALDNRWGTSAVAVLIYYLITSSVPLGTRVLGWDYPLFNLWSLLCLPLGWGFSVYFLSVSRDEEAGLSVLFSGYKDFVRIFFTYFLQVLYIFLWSLLLVIPGIIKSLSYAMTPYVLRDNPDLKYDATITESMRLMDGHKMKLFLLMLSFIGWALLCLLTFGVGFLLLSPYMQTSIALFYEDLVKEDRESSSFASEES